MALCTATIKPKDRDPKCVLFFCHGFGDHVSFLKRHNLFRFVNEGIAVATIEYEGHGRSDGPLGLIPDFNQLVDDVVSFFQEVSEHHFPGKKCFLMGEVSLVNSLRLRCSPNRKLTLLKLDIIVNGRGCLVPCLEEEAIAV